MIPPELAVLDTPETTRSGQRTLRDPTPVETVGTEEALLHQLVERQARIRPDAPAVGMGGDVLGYRELDEAANQMARSLRAAGCGPGDRVAFLLEKSVDAVVTIVAALKAGCVYVPLDSRSPPPRIAKTVRRAEPAILVAHDETRTSVRGLGRSLDGTGLLPMGWLSDDPPAVDGLSPAFTPRDVRKERSDAVSVERSLDDPAYVFFTSGSTGRPKGVVVTHRNVLSFARWGVEEFDIGPDDRNSAHAPLHFDLSTFDLFGSFAAGASVHLVPREANLHPRRLAEWIRRTEVTQWFSVPSVLTYMANFDVVRDGDFGSLERLLWCGEVLPTPTLIHWMERLPHVSFTNLYGPTEATVASSYYTMDRIPTDPRAEIPIGEPCAGEDLLVLDDELQPTPPGEVGQLYIEGVGLSPGYWREPEKTREAFRTLPGPDGPRRVYRTGDLAWKGEDGLFYFVGREDTQVKCRGHRIELGEIETALYSLEPVQEAVVVAVPTDGFEGTILACAVVPAAESAASPADLRGRLSELLPSYMLPTRWRIMDRLPKNRNGKVDRKGLEDSFAAEEEQ